MGSLGLFLQCITSIFFSAIMDRLVKRFGTRAVYLASVVFFPGAACVMCLSHSVTVVTISAALTGFTFSALQILPYTLASLYHHDKQVGVAPGQPGPAGFSSSSFIPGAGAGCAVEGGVGVVTTGIQMFPLSKPTPAGTRMGMLSLAGAEAWLGCFINGLGGEGCIAQGGQGTAGSAPCCPWCEQILCGNAQRPHSLSTASRKRVRMERFWCSLCPIYFFFPGWSEEGLGRQMEQLGWGLGQS
uniref:Solute carrier family 45 member 3 n=1 Tax=Zonotrichia albicollis TaxID=44394 RepID=A0A8D2QEX5_ZONAL